MAKSAAQRISAFRQTHAGIYLWVSKDAHEKISARAKKDGHSVAMCVRRVVYKQFKIRDDE